MTRVKGSKNKPKDEAYYLAKIAELKGEKPNETTIERPESPSTGNSPESNGLNRESNSQAKILILDRKEREAAPEIDTYKCGNCFHIMTEELPICPACQAALTW